MVDRYEFEKSHIPQGVEYETPYVSQNFNYAVDINGGVYQSQGLSLVQFDLTSIFNSQTMVDPTKMFLTVPLVLASALTTNNTTGALVPPTAGTGWGIHGLKAGYYNLLHQADLVINGKIIEQTQPYLNIYTHLKTVCQMSQDDLKTFGSTLGLGTTLDNWESLKYNTSVNQTGAAGAYPGAAALGITAGLIGGNGLSNNMPFAFANNADAGDEAQLANYLYGTYNNGLFSRLNTVVDTTINSATSQCLFGPTAAVGANATTIMNATQLTTEFKNYYTLLNTNYAVSYYTAVIRLQDIFDSMKNMPLMQKFDGTLRLYFNMGAVASYVQNTAGYMVTSQSTNTFSNTCPLLQSCLNNYPGTTTGIISGVGISTAPITNLFGGVNLSSSGARHPMPSCRIYYPQIQIKPELLIPYIENNRNKKVCYTSWLYNQFNGITSGSSFSNLVQSGIKSARGVWIVPFQSSTVNGTVNAVSVTGVTTFSQLQSPFDTAPATNGPFSLTNIQVSLGGVNILNNVLLFTYENFLEQTSMYEKINGGDLGLSCGLINQIQWENAMRFYYVDLSRSTVSDLNTTKQLNISFNNNTNCTIDVMFFIERFKSIALDVQTGIVQEL